MQILAMVKCFVKMMKVQKAKSPVNAAEGNISINVRKCANIKLIIPELNSMKHHTGLQRAGIWTKLFVRVWTAAKSVIENNAMPHRLMPSATCRLVRE